ncbi:sirohydrochlorin chelatase [Comamonas sp. GB3 AK4-5]|uniref:sirohydrochlorin chelatase n=1 Tax=Comamonas sp. GB3 AK4-5 TaxID=3231487 RepID=UPI00351E9DF2
MTAASTSAVPRSPRAGVLLFAHGSRDPLWHRPIQAVQAELQRLQPDLACICAYLEISSPSLPAAVDQLVQQGCSHITVLPLFLGTGRHAREDLPLLLDAARAAHPGLVLESATPVGEDPRVIGLLAQIAQGEMHKKSKS